MVNPAHIALACLTCLVPCVAQEQRTISRSFSVYQVTQPSLATSPDGETLYFQLLGDLVAVSTAGGPAKILTEGPAYDSWPTPSADGKSLYFLSDRVGFQNQIHRLNLEDLSVEQLTDLDLDLRELTVMPDGSEFAARSLTGVLWRRLEDGKPVRERLPPLRNLHLLADGSLVALSREEKRAGQIQRGGPRGQTLLYEPAEGQRIEWASVDSEARYIVSCESGPWAERKADALEIVVVELATNKVLYRCANGPYAGASDLETRAAFAKGKAYVPRGAIILEVDLLTGKAKTFDWLARVTHSFPIRGPRKVRKQQGVRRIRGLGDIRPSPDGAQAVFGMLGDIYIAGRGGAPQRLTSGVPFDSQPVFTGDGESIYFARDGELHSLALEGGVPEALEVRVSAGYFDQFCLSPDGSSLVTIGSLTAPGVREYDFESEQWHQRIPGRGGRGMWIPFPSYGAAGLELVCVGQGGRGQIPQVHTLDPGSNQAQALTRLERAPTRAAASEDGLYLAILLDGRAWIAERGEDLLDESAFRPLGSAGAHSIEFSWDSAELWVGNGTRLTIFGCDSGEVLDDWQLQLEATPEPAAEPLILEGFGLVDVQTGELHENRRLHIEAGRIQSVERAIGDPPSGVRVIRGEGRFLMPGLFDMHVHQLGKSRQAMLAYGVTSVRQLGAVWPRQRIELELNDLGRLLGPRVFSAGEIFEGARSAWGNIFHLIDSEAEALSLIDRRAEQGVDTIKLYPTLARRYAAPIIERAHRLGLPVTAHVASLRDVVTGVSDGLDCIEHYPEHVPDIGDDLLALLKNAAVAFCPTLSVRGLGDFKMRLAQGELEEELFRRAVDPVSLRNWRARPKIDFSSDDNLGALLAHRSETLARAVRIGIQVLVGSDCSLGNALIGPSTHWEIEALVMGGLSPREALYAATRAPAVYAGYYDRGSLRPGQLADMVVLRQNPLVDITNTRSIDAVVQGGRWYGVDELLPGK